MSEWHLFFSLVLCCTQGSEEEYWSVVKTYFDGTLSYLRLRAFAVPLNRCNILWERACMAQAAIWFPVSLLYLIAAMLIC
ncbi:hypothetical protein B0O99DRAFT_635901 [Bisporella sp. PMI_857]|nr:hypothetical protein B0O99DRAFT_635901 [Bisporella sp. PMI_857]